MSRNVLAVVGVAVLLVTAGCVGSLDSGAADAATQGSSDGGQTINVAASGQAQAEPDQAVVQLAAVARADDADTVRERLAANASRLQSALADLGVPDDRVRTVAYRIDRRHDRTTTGNQPRGFEGYHAFEVTLSNASRAGAVIDAAVANGADRVDGVELTLSEERRQEVRADALRDAMENAREDADVVAESGGLRVTGVHSASTGDVSYQPVRLETAEADVASDGASTQVDSGPVTVTAQVQVTYNATAA